MSIPKSAVEAVDIDNLNLTIRDTSCGHNTKSTRLNIVVRHSSKPPGTLDSNTSKPTSRGTLGRRSLKPANNTLGSHNPILTRLSMFGSHERKPTNTSRAKLGSLNCEASRLDALLSNVIQPRRQDTLGSHSIGFNVTRNAV